MNPKGITRNIQYNTRIILCNFFSHSFSSVMLVVGSLACLFHSTIQSFAFYLSVKKGNHITPNNTNRYGNTHTMEKWNIQIQFIFSLFSFLLYFSFGFPRYTVLVRMKYFWCFFFIFKLKLKSQSSVKYIRVIMYVQGY